MRFGGRTNWKRIVPEPGVFGVHKKERFRKRVKLILMRIFGFIAQMNRACIAVEHLIGFIVLIASTFG